MDGSMFLNTSQEDVLVEENNIYHLKYTTYKTFDRIEIWMGTNKIK